MLPSNLKYDADSSHDELAFFVGVAGCGDRSFATEMSL
ncbi:hypothetical protein SAMN05518847_104329 [Paenibacillus sp. OV219]|nr:hypothetical protein SAMN05518847_104329 [Paenibacillus sp. OV219]